MESFLIYILKASALLGIFYLSYQLLLKKETSFQLNRKFLISGILTAAVLPLLYFTRKIYIEASPQVYDYIPTSEEVSTITMETPTDWWQIAGIIYIIISGFFIFRLTLQLSSVLKIILNNSPEKKSGFNFLKTTENQLPFSFFKYIVFNPDKHSAKDLDLILEHEKVHALQYHSVDILIVNLVSCLFWFNPFAWLYKISVEQNLEFIADRETVNKKAEIKEYQHALVKVSIADLKPALTNHFYQSFIKKRILMLNKKSSTQSPAWKLTLVMPLLLAFMLLFNVKTEAQVVQEKKAKGSSKAMEAPQAKEDIEIEEIEENQAAEEVEANEAPEIEEIVEVEAAPQVSWTTSRVTPRRSGVSKLGIDPLYILNGKKIKASKLSNKYIGLRSNLEILVGEDAVNRFGEDAKSGAIIIPDAEVIRNFNKEMKDVNSHEKFRGRYMMIGDNGKPNFINLNSGQHPTPAREVFYSYGNSASSNVAFENSPAKVWHTGTAPNSERTFVIRNTRPHSNEDMYYEFKSEGSNSIRVISEDNISATSSGNSRVKIISQDGEDPIYIVDGTVVDKDFDINTISPSNISSMSILKGKSAIDKYGKKAKNGAIQIFTKSYKGDEELSRDPRFFAIAGNLTDTDLKGIETKIENSLGIKVKFTEVKRNRDGQITKINISGKKDDQNTSMNLSDSEGLQTIIIGLSKKGDILISTKPVKGKF